VQQEAVDGVGDVPALDERDLPDALGVSRVKLNSVVSCKTRTVPGVAAKRAVVAAKCPAKMTASSTRELLKKQ
jgi:hypothetical protein